MFTQKHTLYQLFYPLLIIENCSVIASNLYVKHMLLTSEYVTLHCRINLQLLNPLECV